MAAQNLVLFQAIGAKMDYLNQRQRIIAQNISNADTPGYRPKDIVGADFGTILKGITRESGGVRPLHMEGTQNSHISSSDEANTGKSRKQKQTYEVAPAGNAVIMEEQLINSGQNVMDYNLMVNLMQKNVSLIKTSMGRGQ